MREQIQSYKLILNLTQTRQRMKKLREQIICGHNRFLSEYHVHGSIVKREHNPCLNAYRDILWLITYGEK